MTAHAFRLVNVFAEAPLAGNALCVFEDGRGLDDATREPSTSARCSSVRPHQQLDVDVQDRRKLAQQ
jgi:hypothetical protein